MKKFDKYVNEELKFKQSKDLEDWTGRDKVVKVGKKTLDLNVGSKILDIMEQYGLTIFDFGKGDYLEKQKIIFGDEKDLYEIRVTLGKIISLEDYIENEYGDVVEEEMEEIEKEYESKKVVEADGLEFSVFLTDEMKNDKYAVLSDALNYLRTLNKSYDDVIKLRVSMDHPPLSMEPNKFKEYLNLRKIEVSNKNLEIVPDVEYRLHKDCKIFNRIADEIGEREMYEMFREWLKVVNENLNF